MKAQDTISKKLKRLEDEVLAYKTSQPFYDGQFTPSMFSVAFPMPITTNKAYTEFDVYLYIQADQPHAIFEPYLTFELADGTPLGSPDVQYLINQNGTSEGPVEFVESYVILNAGILNQPIGTLVNVYQHYLYSDIDLNLSHYDYVVRP